MKKFETEKITDLSEVFFAVMGGQTEDIREMEEFMKTSPLNRLMHAVDLERILKYDGFFADEVDAVYALLPLNIRLNEHKSILLTPQAFRKLNVAKVAMPASRFINIDFPKAYNVYCSAYPEKMRKLVKEIRDGGPLQENRKTEISDPKKETQSDNHNSGKTTARKHYYSRKREKGSLPKIVLERQKKVEMNKKEEEKKNRETQAQDEYRKQEKKRLKKELKQQQKEVERAEKRRLLEEKREAKRLEKEDQKKLQQNKKNREKAREQQKINEEIAQIKENREKKQKRITENQQEIRSEIAKLDKKKQDLEERKNKPLGNLTEEERNKEKNRRHMAEYRAKNKKNTKDIRKKCRN